jgi:5-methylthioadenosine/S-adenosylhomocysteine deaminase
MWIMPDVILTMAGDPTEGHAIRIEGERIADIIPSGQVPPDTKVERYPGSICHPAFVNLHTHLLWSNWRGVGDNLPLSRWIYERIVKVFKGASEEDKRRGIELGISRSFAAGITTVCDAHFEGDVFNAAIEKGLRGIFFLEAFGIYSLVQKNEIKRAKDAIEKMLENSTDDQRVGFSPHAPYSVTPAVLKELVPWARQRGLRLSTHLAETNNERQYFSERKGEFASKLRMFPHKPDLKCSSPFEYYAKYNLLGPDVFLVHCVDLNPDEIKRIGDSGSHVATCPTSNAKLGCGIAPVTSMLDAGIDVGLGTDSEASCDEFDIYEEMRRLILFQRAAHGGIVGLDAKAALEMCTSKAAKMAGFDDVGTIEVGKAADIVATDIDTSGLSSHRDHYNRLVWGAHKGDIRLVLTKGRRVYERESP